MAGNLIWHVSGARELGEAMQKHADKIQGQIARKAVKRAAEITETQAKRNAPNPLTAPYSTGALQKAITSFRLNRSSKPGFEQWAVGVGKSTKKYVRNKTNIRKKRVGQTYAVEGPIFYWKFVEFGTVKMDAKPFLGPAMKETAGRDIDVIMDEIRKCIAAIRPSTPPIGFIFKPGKLAAPTLIGFKPR